MVMPYRTENDRSPRSQEAIDNFRVPIVLINEETIRNFLDKCMEESTISKQDFKYMQRFSQGVWQYVSKECVKNEEWHHFGRYYSKVIHYDLAMTLRYILEHKNTIVKDYIAYKLSAEEDAVDFKSYPICKFAYNIWGGPKRHPRIVDVEHKIGLDDGTGVYYMERGQVKRKKWAGNNIYRHSEKRYEELDEQTKEKINAIYEYLSLNDIPPIA